MGAKKAPFYRIVVADSRYPRDGRFIEEIGVYDPTREPSVIKIDAEKAKKWIANGAQPTDTVRALMKSLAPDYIDGLSLLGGEPFEPENQRALVPFLHEVRVLYPHKTIWCYTGNVYETELLQPSHARCEATPRCPRKTPSVCRRR